jgi:DNA replication protein DnaC
MKGKIMILNQTVDRLNQMKLYGMTQSLEALLARPESQELSIADAVGMLVDAEWTARENKRMHRLIQNAQFKEKEACIEALDTKSARGLKKTLVVELTQNQWIHHAQNILITGPSGSGKSFFAQALGHHATRYGFSVHYIRMPKLSFALVQSRADGSYLSYLKKLAKTKVLILDDLGLAPMTEQERQDLMEIIEDRHQVGPTLITSQLPVNAWHAYLGGSLVAEGILDRLIHNVHRVELKTIESLRSKKPVPSNLDLTAAESSAN